MEAPCGRRFHARAIIDPGSEVSFSSHALIQRLGSTQHDAHVSICAVGGKQIGASTKRATIRILSRITAPRHLDVSVLILRQLGLATPSRRAFGPAWQHLEGLDLADPEFARPGNIDILLGADVYSSLILDGVRHGPNNTPVAQRTILGWIVTGGAGSAAITRASHVKGVALTTRVEPLEPLEHLLRKFWELEEVTGDTIISAEDQECERMFAEGCQRSSDGRYTVRLPFKSFPVHGLGDTLTAARRSLDATEARMRRNPTLQKEYTQFMTAYEQLNHMRLVMSPGTAQPLGPTYYIPHHGIWQENDGKRKLRVVFNASQRSRQGASLNDLLHTGPSLQADLATVLTRWRFHRIAFCTDIEMMYRQIRVDPRDVNFQRIVWRQPNEQREEHYQLLTVTYGMSCAPYLAIRTLQQLAHDEEAEHPEAACIVREATYVDDVFSGADDEVTAGALRDQLIALLRTGGFRLRKWASNHPPLLEPIAEDARLRPNWLSFEDGGPVKALGVSWDPIKDEFRFDPPIFPKYGRPTKRQVLAAVASLFDPVGWLSPVVISAKILMQDIWRQRLDWDDKLPPDITARWLAFETNLNAVTEVRVPRWLQTTVTDQIEIHGFADASQHAYAAAVYIQATNADGRGPSRLLSAKTRVAPVKTISIPRLELCAAVLLTRLLCRTIVSLGCNRAIIHAWSDSQVVLTWLQSEPSRWTVFVANRVSEVQTTLKGVSWRHVASSENPADLATRGVEPRTLAECSLWWNGPPWLIEPSHKWPKRDNCPKPEDDAAPDEARKTVCLQAHVEDTLITRFSSLTHLLRVTSRCLRLRHLLEPRSQPLLSAPLRSDEMDAAYHRCVSLSQRASFPVELEDLARGRQVSRGSRLSHLHPFLDPNGVIRVGGRLSEAPLPYAQRHPVILASDCHLSSLVIDWAHRTALHGGFSLTFSRVLQRAWITGGRARTRAHVRNCVTCVRARARTSTQLMGNLPAERVTPSQPFSRTGVDYAGPFNLKTTKGRGHRSTKGYIALFVCLCTKAVHLEVVGDLTTASFIAALRRLAGRRGVPREIWSDNATTFHGANAELRAMLREAEIQWDLVAGTLANDGTTWRFIPPSAPHFGGIWEAAIKSAKAHLKRVIGNQLLTYEELSTFTVQVEGCMNSRPLIPTSGEIDDLDILTPGHLLTGSALATFPEPSQPGDCLDHLTHWRLVQAMKDHFWRRWAKEYLNTLQQRHKWTRSSPNLQVGDLVLIVDASLLRHGKWPMGRIQHVYPGRDGMVRVASVRTTFGTYDRPIVKLCRLPIKP